MTPTRELLWNVPEWAEIAMYLGAAVAFLMLATDVARRIGMYRRGRPGPPLTGTVLRRLGEVVRDAFLQMRLARDRYAAVMHLPLFWGFVVLLIGTIILAFQIDFGLEFFHGSFYQVFSFFMEVAGLAFLLGIALAMYRRWVRRPTRLTRRWDDQYALVVLLLLGVTGFLVEGARIYAEGFPDFERSASFAGYAVAKFLSLFGSQDAFETVHRWSWVSHMAIAIVFVGLLSYTKFLHVFTTPSNIFLRDRRPKGAMTFVPDIEEVETVGTDTVTALPWPDLVDLDACTRCGRCEDACPAHAAGRPLSPMRLVLSEQGVMRSSLGDDPDPDAEHPGVYDVIGEDEVWSCVTCRSCVEQCPADLDQMTKILELRRYLTNEGKLTGSAAKALESMSMRGNPWQLKQQDRLGWATEVGLEVPVMALLQDPDELAGVEPEPVDYLLFVGCAGSYDPRAQKVARALVRLLEVAGVSYAVLGEEETCSCEAARRMGEEMLFQVGSEAVKETIDQYRFRQILTMCPHCYNTLKNDYPQLGARWEVVHHTELLLDLLREGRLPAPAPVAGATRITYHDSCYLGRYNDIYDTPRALVRAVPGAELVEMPRHRRESFCCGGGGGQMWAEIGIGEPIEFIRTREALATGAETVATACPYCKIMLDDGLKHEGREDVALYDLAELLAASLEGQPQA
jgi:Fe-S oxidoreductase/nitrate reductase gamma subunit